MRVRRAAPLAWTPQVGKLRATSLIRRGRSDLRLAGSEPLADIGTPAVTTMAAGGCRARAAGSGAHAMRG